MEIKDTREPCYLGNGKQIQCSDMNIGDAFSLLLLTKITVDALGITKIDVAKFRATKRKPIKPEVDLI
jgi:hypothetical protein